MTERSFATPMEYVRTRTYYIRKRFMQARCSQARAAIATRAKAMLNLLQTAAISVVLEAFLLYIMCGRGKQDVRE